MALISMNNNHFPFSQHGIRASITLAAARSHLPSSLSVVIHRHSSLLPSPSLPTFPPSDAMRSILERNKKKMVLVAATPTPTAATPLLEPAKLHIWKLSYRLWNACVDRSNAASFRPNGRWRMGKAKLCEITTDLLLLIGNPAEIPSTHFKSASYFHKIGQIWHELGRFDLVDDCFKRATDLTSTVMIDAISSEKELRKLRIFELSPDSRLSTDDSQPLCLLLEDLESSIKEAKSLSLDDPSSSEKLTTKLWCSLSRLTTTPDVSSLLTARRPAI